MSKDQKLMVTVRLRIEAKNYSAFQKLMDNLPKFKDATYIYSSGNSTTLRSKASRTRRLQSIMTCINKKPLQVYTSKQLQTILSDYQISPRTINRDLMLLSLDKKIVIETINDANNGRFNICGKNEKVISNYKKLIK